MKFGLHFLIPKSKRKEQKTVNTPKFLQLYSNIIQDNGLIHLKTDSEFYMATQGNSRASTFLEDAEHDIYNAVLERENMDIKTHYEKLFLEKYAN